MTCVPIAFYSNIVISLKLIYLIIRRFGRLSSVFWIEFELDQHFVMCYVIRPHKKNILPCGNCFEKD